MRKRVNMLVHLDEMRRDGVKTAKYVVYMRENGSGVPTKEIRHHFDRGALCLSIYFAIYTW